MARKTDDEDLDLTGWEEAKKESAALNTTFGPRNELLRQAEDAYFLQWANKPSNPEVKVTISPTPRTKVQGASRLLTATVPKWALPRDKNNPDTEQISSKIEQLAGAIWSRSNAVQQLRMEEDLALSGFLYDEIQCRVISTQDILKSIQAASKNAEQDKDYDEARWQNEIEFAQGVAERTCFLYEAINPLIGTYIKSRLGLEVHYTETDVLVADILAQFGQTAQQVLAGEKSYVNKTMSEWWDKTYHYVWVKGKDRPLIAAKHQLKMIPVVVVRAEGTTLFAKPERQSEPFLYTALKTGLIERQNEMLTVRFTTLAALINAQFVHQKGNESADPINPRHNVIGGVIELEPGGQFGPLAKNIIDPAIESSWQLTETLLDQATIYDQALGERISGSDNYSMVALLAQAGRLPLVPVKEALQTAFNGIMEISFKWLKQESRITKYGALELKADEIPARLEFQSTVEVDLPQDKLQQSTIADNLTRGDDPLVSKDWARTNVLGEGQGDELQKQIWREQAARLAFTMGAQPIVAGIVKQAAMMFSGGPGSDQANKPPSSPPGPAGNMPTPEAPPPEAPTSMAPPATPLEGAQPYVPPNQ